MSTQALTPQRQLQLNPLITENPHQTALEQGRRATLYSLAGKVSLTAFLAIAAAVLTISFGIVAPLPSLMMLGLVASTIPLQVGFQTCLFRSMACSNAAKEAANKAKFLDRIQNWSEPQIAAFFKEHKLRMQGLPVGLLRKIDPKEPLRALLPAIAAYEYHLDKAKQFYDIHLENLYNESPDPALRLKGRQFGWRTLEFSALPSAFKAALALQTAAIPTLQSRLSDMGDFRPKDFDERRFDQLLGGSDEFFIFKDEGKAPLLFAELQEALSRFDIDEIRLKLFPKEGQSDPAPRP